MALATQCPHCHTTFRVAHDQLKLRAGLVRCGACKEIFNGIENLLRPDDLRPAPPAAPPASTTVPAAASSLTAADGAADSVPAQAAPETDDTSNSSNRPEPEAEPTYSDFFEFLMPKSPDAPPAADAGNEAPATDATPDATPDAPPVTEQSMAQPASEPVQDDPLTRMTLMDFRHRDDDDAIDDPLDMPTAPSSDLPDPIDRAIDDLQRKPRRRASEATADEQLDAPDEADLLPGDGEEPSFVKKARRRQRMGPFVTLLMALGSVLLLAALVAQTTYAFRQQLAARFPQTKPALVRACALIGCKVGLPSRIDALTIESNELQTVATDSTTYLLSTLLRNRAAIVQAWPNIELTLNDANEKPLVRRVFTPREYLANAADVEKGFAAGTEQAIKLYFELEQLQPAGYRVYIFYP